MNAKYRLAQITQEIAELEAERTRLTAAMQEPNDGAIVRWTDRIGLYRAARRTNTVWSVDGDMHGRSWDELLELVDGARLEIADSFSTYLSPVVRRLCPECAERKPDVRRRMDPYDRDVNGFERYVMMCDDCHNRRAEDV